MRAASVRSRTSAPPAPAAPKEALAEEATTSRPSPARSPLGRGESTPRAISTEPSAVASAPPAIEARALAPAPQVERRRSRRREAFPVFEDAGPNGTGPLPEPEIASLAPGPLEVLQSRAYGHVAAVLGAMAQLGLTETIEPERSQRRSLIIALIASRILEPRTRIAAPEGVRALLELTSLGEMLGVSAAGDEHIQASLDWLVEHGKELRARLIGRQKTDGLILYQIGPVTVPSGDRADLEALRGESKGLGRAFVIGVWCDLDGAPVAVELIDPEDAAHGALSQRADKLQQRLRLGRVVIAGPRRAVAYPKPDAPPPLPTQPRAERLVPLRRRDIQRLFDRGRIPADGWQERGVHTHLDPERPSERILIWWNAALASEQVNLRSVRMAATERALDEIASDNRRATRGKSKKRLAGADRIGATVARIFERFGTAEFFRVTIAGNSFHYALDEDVILRHGAIDGLEAVRSHASGEAIDPEAVPALIERWKRLEREFRGRVLEDWRTDRVGAHAMLTMLALAVEHHLCQIWRPILEGELPLDPRTAVSSPPPGGSELRPITFRALLAELATVSRIRLRQAGRLDGPPEFERITTPNVLVRRALDLAGAALR
jgi:hypothetical protein